MNPYIYLGGAILAEVIGTTLMKFSEGFTRLLDWPPESPDNQYHLNK
ncbi:Multidrug transporter EmrE [Escherichia coli]|nr:Multidrug transporter EmrE [Escherichia coli]RDP50856.1 Multidrug transporter EmrE [Escherichia coli]